MARNVGIQMLRGIAANIPSLLSGEQYFATDTQKLFVGTASGNLQVGPTPNNASVASQTVNATTAIITNSLLPVPTSKLKIGSTFQWNVNMSKTAAGTGAVSFQIRAGTTGTVSDTILMSFGLGVGTPVIDTGQLQMIAVCRGPLSASCIFSGSFLFNHGLATTGLSTSQTVSLFNTSAVIDATQSGLILSLSAACGAAQVLSFPQTVGQAYGL